jgi:hypothetical protein
MTAIFVLAALCTLCALSETFFWIWRVPNEKFSQYNFYCRIILVRVAGLRMRGSLAGITPRTLFLPTSFTVVKLNHFSCGNTHAVVRDVSGRKESRSISFCCVNLARQLRVQSIPAVCYCDGRVCGCLLQHFLLFALSATCLCLMYEHRLQRTECNAFPFFLLLSSIWDFHSE